MDEVLRGAASVLTIGLPIGVVALALVLATLQRTSIANVPRHGPLAEVASLARRLARTGGMALIVTGIVWTLSTLGLVKLEIVRRFSIQASLVFFGAVLIYFYRPGAANRERR